MQFDRNDLLASVIADQLENAQIGVVVRGLTNINVERVARLAAAKSKRELHVASSDYPVPSNHPNISFTRSIEKAVLWRSMPEKAGRLVVFVLGEKKRLHSLEDLNSISARDLTSELIKRATKELSNNVPQTKFWEVLRSEAASFPLSRVEQFVIAVRRNSDNIESIPSNLWRLGLLRDDKILQSNYDPAERLRRNRHLIVEMSQLSEQSRRRMSSVLTKSAAQPSLRTGLKDVMEFFRLGGDDTLRRLSVDLVEQIIRAGRPLPAPTPSKTAKDDDLEHELDAPSKRAPGPEKPLRGRSLQEAIAEVVLRRDGEAERGLHELGESYRRKLEQPQQADEPISPRGFHGRILQADSPSNELRSLIGSVCTPESWGGILVTDSDGIKEAIRHARPEDFQHYNPDDPSQGVLGQCLFSLLRRFDEYLPGSGFTSILDSLVEARTILLSYLDLLLAYPFVLFGGYKDARTALTRYLKAYTDLIHGLRQHDAILHSRDANALKYVIMQILRLEVVYIQTPNEWKAILTPLHVFNLWRFNEIINAARNGQHPLTDEEQKQLARALPDLPHLLHFAIVSPEITGDKRIDLPHAGNLDLLPTYENHTNRYLGNDGLFFLNNLLRRWLDYAPYSKPQIRLALVDTPDLRASLNSIGEFLENVADTRIHIDCYFTRGQNGSGDLARLEYEDRDHELARLLQAGKISLELHNHSSLADVTTALAKHPVHIAYLFDQSQYQLGYAPKARQLLVTPLVVTYQYEYSETFQRGTIAPSSEADEGLFADFHFLVHRAAHLPPGQQIRLQHEGDMDLKPINTLLESGTVRWLVAADRVLTPYKLDDAVPLSEQRSGQREIGVWTKSSTRTVDHFVDLLRQFNLYPDSTKVAELLRRFSHVAAGGIFSIPLAASNVKDLKEKGFLGTVLAAAWYTEEYPGALVASLDSSLAQQWLRSRAHSSERADLIGLRLENQTLWVEPIEVKTWAEGSEAHVSRDIATGERALEGRAVDQLKSMLQTLGPVFGALDDQPLFTPARREVLKYQLHRECFREVHDPNWQREWYQNLRRAFTLPQPTINVSLRGLVLHVHLEENATQVRFEDPAKRIARVKLGTSTIQKLVSKTIDAPSTIRAVVNREDDSDQSEQETRVIQRALERKSGKLRASKDAVVPERNNRPIIQESTASDAEELSHSFQRACQSFRIELAECDASRAIAGPTIWRFYVRLARGQRIDPLRNALEDIGREMRRSGLLVTTIPNSDEIALDIPRETREALPLMRVLDRLKPPEAIESMPIPIGVTPEGKDILRDLSLMPHLLVGGTTGSGKTVFLYGLLAALLKTHPDPKTLRLLLSTSGPEDFTFFEGLPHLEEGRVIADAGEAIELLQTHVNQIFEHRQQQLSDARCRDVGEYNARHSVPLPPFVVVVDEFADLADQLAGNKAKREAFYTNIRRIAQLGRKRALHLVLCTQRPSADLVPTNIRNLMNVRVALHVNDATASRMVLDEVGAERLQMKGDLLFKEEGSLLRAQGYYVTSQELDRILQPYRIQTTKKTSKQKVRR